MRSLVPEPRGGGGGAWHQTSTARAQQTGQRCKDSILGRSSSRKGHCALKTMHPHRQPCPNPPSLFVSQHSDMGTATSYGYVLGREGGFKWPGCIVRIRLWLRLPHSCHRLLSSVSASCASPGAIGLCILAPRCSLALWTPLGYAYIQVSGHSLPEVLLLAPFGPSRLGCVWSLG